MRTFRSVKEAVDFLTYHFRTSENERKENQFRSPSIYLDRSRYLYSLLNNPQQKFRLIHIAGTSGKGSTAHILGKLLSVHNQSTGVYTSPHLISYNERFVIDGQKITDTDLLQCLNNVLDAASTMANTSFGKPSFFEISNAIAYLYFAQKNVGYSVIETHVGGIHDSTNTELDSNKVSIITEIGFDHQGLLGDTLTSIAYHKAGIMNLASYAFALSGETESNTVIAEMAQARNVNLVWVNANTHYKNVIVSKTGMTFDYQGATITIKQLSTSLVGEHQARNISIALAALEHIARRDNWSLNEDTIRQSLVANHQGIAGRIEHKKIQNRDCYFDVAHNEQKLSALVKTLHALYPEQKFTFVIAFKKDKLFQRFIDILSPYATCFIITSFSPKTFDTPFSSVDPRELSSYIQKQYPYIVIEEQTDTNQAFATALSKKEPIIVTGSFYLVSQILQNLSQ